VLLPLRDPRDQGQERPQWEWHDITGKTYCTVTRCALPPEPRCLGARMPFDPQYPAPWLTARSPRREVDFASAAERHFQDCPALRYLGVDSFALKGIAHVERYFFAETSGGVVRRLLAFQFEDILPGVDEIYRWQLRSPRLIGGETYHSAFVFSVPSQVLAEPNAEIARTVAFLGRQGLRLEDEQLVARFARVIGDDRRHEFIIFYNEPLAATGHALAEVRAADEDLKPEFVGLRTAITARALESFTVRGPS
jgi:hypothetical protein